MGMIVKLEWRWPNGLIYYQRGKQCNAKKWELIVNVMKKWENFVNHNGPHRIQFKEIIEGKHSNGKVCDNYIEVVCDETTSRTDAGCVGLRHGIQVGGRMVFQVAFDDIKNIPHEVGHIIGLGHEHMHSDSTAEPKEFFAERQMEQERKNCDEQGVYDKKSIMHYSGDKLGSKFNKIDDWKTTVRAQPSKELVEDSYWTPSWGDIHAIRQMYPAAIPSQGL